MKFLFALLSTLVLYLGVRGPLRAAPTAQDLQVYFIDVEGGQATLFVTPLHESLLIDTGWAGHHGRDAARIARAARLAGITTLDYVLITHYHDDHVGGVSQLIARMRVGTFIDHGENRETTDAATEHNWEQYKKLVTAGQARRLTVKPGDRLPLKGMDVTVVSADGLLIHGALASAPLVNDQCTGVAPYPADRTINQLVEEQVARTPDATAVLFEEERLTYAELNRRANRLAHHRAEIAALRLVGGEGGAGIEVMESEQSDHGATF